MKKIIFLLTALCLSTLMANAQDSTPDATTGASQRNRNYNHKDLSIQLMPMHQLKFLTDSLQLSDVQQSKIKEILEDASKNKHSNKLSPDGFKARIDSINQCIHQTLNSDQQVKFEEIKIKYGRFNANRNIKESHTTPNKNRTSGAKMPTRVKPDRTK